MKRFIMALLCLILVPGMMQAASAKDLMQKGETWIYSHEGPRPFSRDDLVDERTRTVISIDGEGEEKRWVVKEMWGSYDERPTRFHLNVQGLVDKQEMGYSDSIAYKNPFPLHMLNHLKKGEEKTLENTIQIGSINDAKYKLTIKRMADETVKVPAGEFKDCQHYMSDSAVTITGEQGAMTFSFHQETWHHADANGMVKEIHTFDPVKIGDNEQPGSKATSQLKEHKIAGE